MSKGRLEAFSDGVLAIIITIMVLELAVPHGTALSDLLPLLPVFLSYVLSFVFLVIYWNNHHHLLHTVHHVNGRVLWANLFLLFWLSLVPFVTAWMGENEFAALPVALYGVVCWMSVLAYYNLSRTIIKAEGKDSELASAVGRDVKGLVSLVLYTVAIVVAFFVPWLAVGIYAATALMWFIPDQRIERRLAG